MSTLPINVPRAVVDLDRPRTIALTLAALKRIKDATGTLDMDLTEDAIFDRAPSIVWASLIDGDREDLTPEAVADLLHAGNLAQVVEALGSLAEASAPKGAEGNAVPAPRKMKAGRK